MTSSPAAMRDRSRQVTLWLLLASMLSMWLSAYLLDNGKQWLGSAAMVQTVLIGLAATGAAIYRLYKIWPRQ